MKKTLRILLADDHQMFRDALRSLLEKSPHIEIVGETGDGLEVVKLTQGTTPDIVCMDIGMPGMNGIEATRRLSTLCPETKVIALSAFAEQRYAMDMFDAGATAYVTKSGAGEELLRAIEAVQNGQKYMCPRIASLIAGTWSAQRDIKLSPPLQLSARCCSWLPKVIPRNRSPTSCSLRIPPSKCTAATSCASSTCTAWPN